MTSRETFDGPTTAFLLDYIDSMSAVEHRPVLPDEQLILGWQSTLSDVTTTEIVRQILPLCGYGGEVDACSMIDEGNGEASNRLHSAESDNDEDEELSLGSIPSTLISLFRTYLLNNNTHITNGNCGVTEGATRDLLLDRTLSTITEESSCENFEFEFEFDRLRVDLDDEDATDTVTSLVRSNTDLMFRLHSEESDANKLKDQTDGCVEESLSNISQLVAAERTGINQLCAYDHPFRLDPCIYA